MPAAENSCDGDLEQPLLAHGRNSNGPNCTAQCLPISDAPCTLDQYKGCSRPEATFNLAITAVGAGVLALPKAFSTVGLVLGLLIVTSAALLTYCSSVIITSAAVTTQLPTYGSIIKAKFGRAGAMLLQLAIILHVAGAQMVYLMIIADILVGIPPHYNGVLCEIFNIHTGVWYLSREFVLAVLVAIIEVPLYSLRCMSMLSKASGACVAITMYMAAMILGLAVVAGHQGKVAPIIHIWPDADAYQHLWHSSPLEAARGVLGALAVAALAFTLHFNLILTQRSLAPCKKTGSTPCMKPIVFNAVLLCTVLYAAVGGAGYVMFGDATRGDVLKNINLAYVKTLVPGPLAHMLVQVLGLTYPLNLLVNFSLRLWGLRENLVGLFQDKDAMQVSTATFYSYTYGSLVAVFSISIMVPSVWFLVEIIGSTACITFAYVFPALLLLTGVAGGRAGIGARIGGTGLLVIAAVIAVFGTYNAIASLR